MDYGIKELYSVVLKSTYNMEIGGQTYEPGEVVMRFDKLLIAHMSEDKIMSSARGGVNNNSLITWDNTRDVQFMCEQGVLSKTGLALLSRSNLVHKNEDEKISVPIVGEEIDPENGLITLKYKPNGTGYIYDLESGKKLYSNLTEQTYSAENSVIADYEFDYSNGSDILEVGHRLFNGYLKLEGKMRLKDDSDGHDKTVIMTIPQIKITSSLTMRLGKNANPTVGNFSFIGYPVGMRGAQKVVSFEILNDDIDSDFGMV